jgi:predicted Fe-S protein YdhL (DUF1289 family)
MQPPASYIPTGGGVCEAPAPRVDIHRPMDSPCTKVCVIDTATGVCAGCGRTLAEIAGWAAMTDVERRRIMRELPRRQARLRPAAER